MKVWSRFWQIVELQGWLQQVQVTQNCAVASTLLQNATKAAGNISALPFSVFSGFKELAKFLKNLINILTILWEGMNFYRKQSKSCMSVWKKAHILRELIVSILDRTNKTFRFTNYQCLSHGSHSWTEKGNIDLGDPRFWSIKLLTKCLLICHSWWMVIIYHSRLVKGYPMNKKNML